MSDAPYYCPHGRAYYEMCLQCPSPAESERHMEKQMVTRHGAPFPRRNCTDLYCPAETAISAARDAVERAGAHPLLTDALNLLNQAQEHVADWYEGRARTALGEGRPE